MSSSIEAINQAAGVNAAAAKTAAKSKDAVMGKQDFLMLLVAQLQNQDPLNPDDPTEFTAQLAQFSSLEQLFSLNEGMASLVAANQSSDRLSTLSTIGKEVAYHGSSINFSGEPVAIGYKLDGPAAAVDLTLRLNGANIATLSGKELTAGNHYLTWDGLTTDGKPAPVGKYTLVLTARAKTGESVAAAPLIRAEVTGVDLGGSGGGTLITTAGEVSFSGILGVYERGSRAASGTETDKTGEVVAAEPVSDAGDGGLLDSLTALTDLGEEVVELVETSKKL
jgi:flagellar basal-body rod modification protein FlgD